MVTCLPFVGYLQRLPVFHLVVFPPSPPLALTTALHAVSLTISLFQGGCACIVDLGGILTAAFTLSIVRHTMPPNYSVYVRHIHVPPYCIFPFSSIFTAVIRMVLRSFRRIVSDTAPRAATKKGAIARS